MKVVAIVETIANYKVVKSFGVIETKKSTNTRTPYEHQKRAMEALELVGLPEKYYDHPLTGDYKGCRECHILPDWLLIYRVEKDLLILGLTRTGTHSDLF